MYSNLSDALRHNNKERISELFNPLKKSQFGEFSEKAFYFVIQHFNSLKNYEEAIQLAEEYTQKHPDGALYNSIRFLTA